MNNTETEHPQLTEFALVLEETNGLAVRDDAEKAALVALLRPIAEGIPGSLQFAEECVITNEAEAKNAAAIRDAMVRAATLAEKSLREFDGKLIDRLYRNHRKWTEIVGMFTLPLNSAAKVIKGKLIYYQRNEEEKAAKEQARLQAEADERARLERARLEKEAAKLKTPELREQRIAEAQAVIAPVVRVAGPTTTVRSQRRWMVKDIKFEQAGISPSLLGYFHVEFYPGGEFKMATLSAAKLAAAKAANSMLEIPGVTFHQVSV